MGRKRLHGRQALASVTQRNEGNIVKYCYTLYKCSYKVEPMRYCIAIIRSKRNKNKLSLNVIF